MLMISLTMFSLLLQRVARTKRGHLLGGCLLELEEIEKPEPLRARGGCWFKVGARQLHIGVEEPFRPATKAHPAFAVRDIDALFGTLQKAGV